MIGGDEDRVVAKLTVLIEGIADHKMSTESQRLLGREIVTDLKALLTTTTERV